MNRIVIGGKRRRRRMRARLRIRTRIQGREVFFVARVFMSTAIDSADDRRANNSIISW
jgi:hypothetical protein